MTQRPPPRFYGVGTYIDPIGRFTARYPTTWHQFELEDNREGVLFSPEAENPHTWFSVWVSKLDANVVAEDLEGLDRGGQVSDVLRRIAATTACHAAVKANYPLTHAKMLHILEELRRTAYSTVCPHGRPVMLRLTRREIEKNFQRI